VALSVVLILIGAEWVVKGMALTERWERMVGFTGMITLFTFAFVAIGGAWFHVIAPMFGPWH
jgi:hypothetical protein